MTMKKTTINQLTQHLNEDLAQMTQASKKKPAPPFKRKPVTPTRPSPMTLDKAEDILSNYITCVPGSEPAFEKLCDFLDKKNGPGSADMFNQYASDASSAYEEMNADDDGMDDDDDDDYDDRFETGDAEEELSMYEDMATEELEKLLGGKRRSLKM